MLFKAFSSAVGCEDGEAPPPAKHSLTSLDGDRRNVTHVLISPLLETASNGELRFRSAKIHPFEDIVAI